MHNGDITGQNHNDISQKFNKVHLIKSPPIHILSSGHLDTRSDFPSPLFLCFYFNLKGLYLYSFNAILT